MRRLSPLWYHLYYTMDAEKFQLFFLRFWYFLCGDRLTFRIVIDLAQSPSNRRVCLMFMLFLSADQHNTCQNLPKPVKRNHTGAAFAQDPEIACRNWGLHSHRSKSLYLLHKYWLNRLCKASLSLVGLTLAISSRRNKIAYPRNLFRVSGQSHHPREAVGDPPTAWKEGIIYDT